jgi:hypothetical protein
LLVIPAQAGIQCHSSFVCRSAGSTRPAASLALPFKGRVGWGWCRSPCRRRGLTLYSSFRRKPESSVFARCLLSKCGSTRPAAERVTFWHCPKSNQKGLAPNAVFCRASCAAIYPAHLAYAGVLRQYIRVLLRQRGEPSPRPFGLIPRRQRCSAPRTEPFIC